MPVTNKESGTNVSEIAEGIYRISTPVSPDLIPGGFTFNQYLIVDDGPLLFETGLRRMFPLVREAVASVIPVERLRYISFSHVEADECGSLNEWLAAAPDAVPLCGRLAAMIQIEDLADRSPHAMADGETVSLGAHSVKWLDAPHVPHAWDCGFIFEAHTGTLLCSDLIRRRLPSRTFWAPANRCAAISTTSRTARTLARSWKSSRRRIRAHSPVCMGAHGGATVRRSSGRLPTCLPVNARKSAVSKQISIDPEKSLR